MRERFYLLRQRYPKQFWLMFAGMLLSTIGSSMIWPFLMIYVSEQLQLPLTTVTSLLAINSTVMLVSSFLGGPVVDRLGRKWVMVLSLALNGVGYIFMSQAHTYPAFALLMGLSGAVNPLYRIGADAMMADLVPPEKRLDAYALLRLSNNLGISLGPTIGGFITSTSYSLAFYFAAAGMILYGLLLSAFARETLPGRIVLTLKADRPRETLGGYGSILHHGAFLRFVCTFTLVQGCAVLIWILMPVYAKENYQVHERLYGLIPTTNAVMVVTLQLAVTALTKRFATLPVLAVGSFFYAIGVGSVALGRGFSGFWFSMVVMTLGELILIPTSSSYVANLAPVDKRGRYMSLHGLSWGVASGVAPLFGGILNDRYGPHSIWYGGLVIGLVATLAFLLMAGTGSKASPGTKEQATLAPSGANDSPRSGR